jgi:hypothetical protein
VLLNSRQWWRLIAVDIDLPRHPDPHAEVDRRLTRCPLEPSWVVYTDKGAHVVFMVEDVHTDQAKAVALYRDTYANLRALLGGDPSYAWKTGRNPWCADAKVRWGQSQPQNLRVMWRTLDAAGLWTKGAYRKHWLATKQDRQHIPGVYGRNCELRDTLRAYLLSRPTWTEADADRKRAEINASFDDPLPEDETLYTMRSVMAFCADPDRVAEHRELSGLQFTREQAAKGGAAGTDLQVIAHQHALVSANLSRTEKSRIRQEQVLRLRREGYQVAQVAEMTRLSKRQVINLSKGDRFKRVSVLLTDEQRKAELDEIAELDFLLDRAPDPAVDGLRSASSPDAMESAPTAVGAQPDEQVEDPLAEPCHLAEPASSTEQDIGIVGQLPDLDLEDLLFEIDAMQSRRLEDRRLTLEDFINPLSIEEGGAA